MGRLIRYVQEDFGLPVIEIQPKAQATFRFRARDLTLVRRFTVASLCRELHIVMIAVNHRMIVQHVPVAEFLATPDDAASEQQLIGRVQACFRYKDHTLEEYRAVIAALAPGAESKDVNWPWLHRDECLEVILENPTREPVIASVAFRLRVAED